MHIMCLQLYLGSILNFGANDPYWQPWEVNEDLFDCMRVYYEQEGKRDNVKVCEEGGIVGAMTSSS